MKATPLRMGLGDGFGGVRCGLARKDEARFWRIAAPSVAGNRWGAGEAAGCMYSFTGLVPFRSPASSRSKHRAGRADWRPRLTTTRAFSYRFPVNPPQLALPPRTARPTGTISMMWGCAAHVSCASRAARCGAVGCRGWRTLGVQGQEMCLQSLLRGLHLNRAASSVFYSVIGACCDCACVDGVGKEVLPLRSTLPLTMRALSPTAAKPFPPWSPPSPQPPPTPPSPLPPAPPLPQAPPGSGARTCWNA